MTEGIRLDVWLYGPLARYGGSEGEGYAHLEVDLPAGSTLADLLVRLEVPPEEKGIIFVSGQLASMPGLEVEDKVTLRDGDRVGIFHRRTMWPFQYRFGAAVAPALEEALRQRADGGIRHAYQIGEGLDKGEPFE